MVTMSITTNFPDVQRQLDRLRDDVARRVSVRAVNRTIEIARTEMGREIRKEYAVDAAYVRERLAIRRAAFKGGQLGMQARLFVGSTRRSANLIRFVEKFVSLAQARKRMAAGAGSTMTLRGGGQVAKALELRFKIKRSGPKQVIKGAFIGNKGRTVFIREGRKRLPIRPLQTIDVAQMFNTRRINDAVVKALQTRFPEVFERELRFALGRFR